MNAKAIELAPLGSEAQQHRVLDLVLDRLSSDNSKIAYARALIDSLDWYDAQHRPVLSKGVVQRYRAILLDAGLAPSSINQKLSAIRALPAEAADNGLLERETAAAIKQEVKGVKTAGTRAGNWLTQAQAQRLLDAPDVRTVKGVRDRAILAVLLGCGLRRAELSALSFDHVQQRDGRWAVVDLVGKGRRIRTVPMPAWTKVAIDSWTAVHQLRSGRIFRSLWKNGALRRAALTEQAVLDIVQAYARPLGFDLAPHDCRRTFAKLALRGGARLEQIQLSLGHASVQTTERYLGLELDLQDAPCDHLGLRLAG
jgi:site-specific recombinase XerD